MKTFDEQIREMQAERQRNEWWAGQRRLSRGEDIYTRFCVWCNAESHPEWKGEPKRGYYEIWFEAQASRLGLEYTEKDNG